MSTLWHLNTELKCQKSTIIRVLATRSSYKLEGIKKFRITFDVKRQTEFSEFHVDFSLKKGVCR